jgi:hypothetical protein
MSALQEEPVPEVIPQDEASVEFVDLTSKKPAPAVCDSFRFDVLLDIGKCQASRLVDDIKSAIFDATGDRNWYVSLDEPIDLDMDGHPYDVYANGDVQPRCLIVWKPGGAPLNSSTTLMLREACLAGIARQPKESAWTNGMGDMYYDIDPNAVTYEPINRHNSVVIDTGSTVTMGSAKKIVYLRFTCSMPDDSTKIVWSDVRNAIRRRLNEIGWDVNDTDFAASSRFNGKMYRWWVSCKPQGDKPKPTPEIITKVWNACLSGAHDYQVDHEDAVILLHLATGSMEIGDQRWDRIDAPALLFVG